VTLGLGYADVDSAEAIGVSAAATLANGLAFGINYTDYDDTEFGDAFDSDDIAFLGTDGTIVGTTPTGAELAALGFDDIELESHIGIGVGYSVGAISLHANYGEYDLDQGDISGFGLTAGYDLGGGAIVQAGYGRSDYDFGGDDEETDVFSLGVRMNF
jgi:outer membrane protein OmpU